MSRLLHSSRNSSTLQWPSPSPSPLSSDSQQPLPTHSFVTWSNSTQPRPNSPNSPNPGTPWHVQYQLGKGGLCVCVTSPPHPPAPLRGAIRKGTPSSGLMWPRCLLGRAGAGFQAPPAPLLHHGRLSMPPNGPPDVAPTDFAFSPKTAGQDAVLAARHGRSLHFC